MHPEEFNSVLSDLLQLAAKFNDLVVKNNSLETVAVYLDEEKKQIEIKSSLLIFLVLPLSILASQYLECPLSSERSEAVYSISFRSSIILLRNWSVIVIFSVAMLSLHSIFNITIEVQESQLNVY